MLRTDITGRIATLLSVAIFVVSCSSSLSEADSIALGKAPMQTLDNMFAVQTKNGVIVMRLEADVMQHYESDTLSQDRFPKGLSVYSYTDEGLLESLIMADDALHLTGKKGSKEELWEAFGNVIIHNVLKSETMETDTLYWDREKQEIYTDCYVRMFSPDGFMQGYGMRSDDRARNSILLRPFNGYAVMERDTTVVRVDSVNFIGPLLKK